MEAVLNDRYKLTQLLEVGSEDSPEVWRGISDKNDEQCAVKIWKYKDELPQEILRLWDNDLRTQYRLVSTPGADESLVTLLDAGHDIDNKSLVMVLGYGDYRSLNTVLPLKPAQKDTPIWARKEWLRLSENRLYLWRGLQNIAIGLKLLHDQSLVHRNVHLTNIFFQPDVGAQSLRLGGFDFSIRLESHFKDDTLPHWHLPPECNKDRPFYNFSTDWYGFGVLVASCFSENNKLYQAKEGIASEFHTALRKALYDNPCHLGLPFTLK